MSDGNKKKTMILTIFGLSSSIVLMFSIAPIRCGFVVCFMMLQWTFFLEMLLLERKVF